MEQKYEVTVNERGEFWRQNGMVHRVNGPAIVWNDGTQVWYQNGKRHRADGPAIIYADGGRHWYIDDEPLSEEEFNRRRAPCNGREVVVEGVAYVLTAK